MDVFGRDANRAVVRHGFNGLFGSRAPMGVPFH